MSVGFVQSVEGLKKIEPDLTWARGILPADRLWTWSQLFPESLSCQPTPLDSGPASSHSLMNQFLKISLSLHLNIGVMLINMKMPSKEGLQGSMFPTVSVYDIIDTLPTISFRASSENCLGGRGRESPWESSTVGTSTFVRDKESAQDKGVGSEESALACLALFPCFVFRGRITSTYICLP